MPGATSATMVPTTMVPTTMVPGYSSGTGREYVVPGNTIQTVPMSPGPGTVYGGRLPTDGQFGMTVVGDRIVQSGEVVPPPEPVKVGQK